jgi:hypothetical protein
MENVMTTIIVLTLWLASILFPFFLTENKAYLDKEESKNLAKARKGTHFLKQ